MFYSFIFGGLGDDAERCDAVCETVLVLRGLLVGIFVLMPFHVLVGGWKIGTFNQTKARGHPINFFFA